MAQARPDRASGKTQVIEPRELVILKTRRKDLRLPRRCRRLESLQLGDDCVERIGTLPLLARCDMLPAKQEAKKILARDGLDFLPQPLDRVAVDAREERAITPLGLSHPGRKQAAHDHAFGDQLCECNLDVGARQSHRAGNRARRGGTQALQPAAYDFHQRVVAGPSPLRKLRGRFDRGRENKVRIYGVKLRQALCRDPDRSFVCAGLRCLYAPGWLGRTIRDTSRAALHGKRIEKPAPGFLPVDLVLRDKSQP